MVLEWDEAKREETLARRNLDFASIEHFDWHTAVYERSDRYSEVRYMATGFIFDSLYTIVFTPREGRIRIISLRKASTGEIIKYAQT